MACHEACQGLPQEFREHHQSHESRSPGGAHSNYVTCRSRQPQHHSGGHHDSPARNHETYRRPHPGLNKTYITVDPNRVPIFLPGPDDHSTTYNDSSMLDPDNTFYQPGPLAASSMRSIPHGLTTYYDDSGFSHDRTSSSLNFSPVHASTPNRPPHPQSSTINSDDLLNLSPDRPARLPELSNMPDFPDFGAAHPHHSHPGGRRAAHHSHGHRRHHSHHGGGHHGHHSHPEGGDDSSHPHHERSAAEEELEELESLNILRREHFDGHFFHDHEDHPLDLSRSQLLSGIDFLEWESSNASSDLECHCFDAGDYATSSDSSGGTELSAFDPLVLNETMAPRSRDWDDYRRYIYGSFVSDLIALEEEESLEISRLLEMFQDSRRGELDATLNESTETS